MGMTSEQRGVIFGMVSAVATTAFVLMGSCFLWPLSEAHAALGDRWALFAISVLPLSLTLTASVARLANHRFHDQRDMGGSATPHQTERAALLQALLQNTLEQAVLGLLAYGCWCLLAPATYLSAVPAAAALFLVGRILFFARYEGGAAPRSFGFALTFYPTAALTLGNVCFAVIRLFSTLHGA